MSTFTGLLLCIKHIANTIKWYLIWSFQQFVPPLTGEKTKFNKAKNPTWGHKPIKKQSLDSNLGQSQALQETQEQTQVNLPGPQAAHSIGPCLLAVVSPARNSQGYPSPESSRPASQSPQHTPDLIPSQPTDPATHPSLLFVFVVPHPEVPSSSLLDMSTFIFLGRISFDNLLPIFLSSLGLAVLFLCPLWDL